MSRDILVSEMLRQMIGRLELNSKHGKELLLSLSPHSFLSNG